MDKNKKQNRTDLLAAGRNRLQQFRKKKDGKGNKSSSKPSNSETGSDAESTSAHKVELVSPQLSDPEGSSVNDSDAQKSASSIPSSQDHTQTTSIDDPLSAPVIPETELVTTSSAHSIELPPEEQVSIKSSVGNEQRSESLESHPVDSVVVVEGLSNNDSGNLERVISEGDSAHPANLYPDESFNLKSRLDTAQPVSVSVEGRVDGADQVTDIGTIQGGDCLASQQIVKDLKADAILGLPSCGESVETAAEMGKGESKIEELNVTVSPKIKIVDVPASVTDDVKEVLDLNSAQPALQPLKSSAVKSDISIRDGSATDAETSCSQSLIPDSCVIERLKEQLYLAMCAKDIFLFQLDEQAKLQLAFDQERQQLLHEISSATNLVSEAGQRNESLCEVLAKYKSDLEAAVNVKDEIEKQYSTAKSEVLELSLRAKGLHAELERSREASTKQLAEIAECKTLLADLQTEIDVSNGNLTFSVEEKDKLAEEVVFLRLTLADCKDSLNSLQVENANLNGRLLLVSEERRNLEEAKANFSGENDRLLTELAKCRDFLEVLRVEKDKLNENLTSAMEDRKGLAEEKSYFAIECERLSLELADCKNLLAGLQLEHCNALDELKEAKNRLEQPPKDNISLPLAKDGLSSAELKDPEHLLGILDFKRHLEEAKKTTQVLDNIIEEIHSRSMFLSTQSGKVVAPVSRLIQAFESKAHDDTDEVKVPPSTEHILLTESIMLAKEQTSSLRTVFKELIRDSKNVTEFLEVETNRNLADSSLVELKVSYEALKEHSDSCEATSIETVVMYEFVKQHLSDIEAQKVTLRAQYDTIRQRSILLEAENSELVCKIGVSQSRTLELEKKMDEMLLRSDELVFSLSNKVDALRKEVDERELKHEQVIQSVRQLCAFVGSSPSTLEIAHTDAHDVAGFVSVSIDAATNFIEHLQENLEVCRIDHEIMKSSCIDMVEKCNDLGGKNELAIGVLHHLQFKLKKLATASSGLEEKSQIIEGNENLVDPLHIYNYDTLIEQISILLNGRLQLESENINLRSELIDKDIHIEELKNRSLDSDAILHLVDDVERTINPEGVGSNPVKLELRLHHLISSLFQKYKEVDKQLRLSLETSTSHEVELSLFKGKIDNLSFIVAQYENEIIILKESLRQGREAFVALQAELQGKVNELEQSEQRVSSIREKLSIAVSKGKGLIVQRDNLKQSLAETSSELEKYSQELQLKNAMLEEVETKLKTYSEAGRVEALESELSYIRNSATALRESFLLKDSVLQKIEEILEDLELPENFHSRDIIEKVDWLARSVTGNALPLTDWDQKSSGGGGSYTDSGFVSTDAWKEDMQQNQTSDDDLIKKYEELQSKYYGLAEQNDMLEQSLMERNDVVQRWEEIIDRVDMPLQLRSMEPEDRIEWLANALLEAHHHCSSLQQKVDHLETYGTALTADLDQSQMRLADLEASIQAITSEKDNLLQILDSSTRDYDSASEMVVKLEFENDKMQKEVAVLQDKLSVEVKKYEIANAKLRDEVTALQEQLAEKVMRYGHIEGEIRRLEEVVSGVSQVPVTEDAFTSSSGTERLEQLLRTLVEQYTTLSLQKSIVSESEGEKIAGAVDIVKREKEYTEENDTIASRKDLEETLYALTCAKEERDRYMEINQSLTGHVEALEVKKGELQELLSQEEQKSASVREKLNVAVRKGKSLVQQRDSLKQSIEEMNKEVERLKSEIKIQEKSHSDYEQKINDLSTNKDRVEVLESEILGLKNLLADTEYFLQEKSQTLSMIVDTLNGFDAGFNNISDPVEKLKQIAKRWHDRHEAMTSSENNFKKAKRSAELLLAELNEVQERNDVLQEEVDNASSKLSELSRERDFSEASKDEAVSHLEKLTSLRSYESNKQLTELMAIKSCLTELTDGFYGTIDLVGNVLSKEVEHLCNLETSIKSCLEPSSAHVGGISLGDSHSIFLVNSQNREKVFLQSSVLESELQECIEENRLGVVCSLLSSRLQVFLKEISVLKEEICRHSVTLDERAKHLSQVAGIVCKEVISQKQSLGSMTENSIRLEDNEKKRDEETVALRKNISLLFEACSSSVMEIENWKSQFLGSNLITEDMQKFLDSSVDCLYSEECSRTVADRLLYAVRDFIRVQTEIIDGGQKDMKVSITNLQKELHEKDIQKERICVEFVNQIREAESAARRHLQDSQSANSQLNDVKRRLEVTEEERNVLKHRIKELEDGESTLKELDERARSLNSVLVAKDQEIEALMQALDEEETQMEDLTNKVSELERVVVQKNTDLENLQASRAKVMKKLSITVGKFDELHHLSASLLSEVEKLQSQVHERDEEISFLRQEVTRCTNDALLASQMSNKRNSNEMHDIVAWLNSVNPGLQGDDDGIDDYKGLLQKQIGGLLSQLEDLREVVRSKDMSLQVEKTKVENLMRREESLENTLREKDSQLSRSSTSEIVEVEPMINKWSVTPHTSQVRTLRKANNDHVAIAIDTNTGNGNELEDEDDDKAHGFKSLTTSRIIPRFTRPVTDMIDGLWVSCDRTLMRQPALRLCVIMYWAMIHALLATFVV